MSRTRLDVLRVLPLFALIVALRVAWIGQYPHHDSDEGFWANGARNQVLFGDAFMDGRLHPFLSPANHAALTACFSFLTPTLVTARLFSAMVSVLACVLVWLVARRLFPVRPWLPVLLFGLSGFVVVLHRMMMLEAHQTFWLVAQAALLFSRHRRAWALAGMAYGFALLVKSNSIYLAPAFVAALPFAGEGRGEDRSVGEDRSAGDDSSEGGGRSGVNHGFLQNFLPLFQLFGAATLVAGVGYGLACAADPQRFYSAFRHELGLEHVRGDDVLLRFGRFGLRPAAMAGTLTDMFRSDPVGLVLAGISIARVARRPSVATRAERFFTAWALGGLLFGMFQLVGIYRYVTTIAPALAFLAAMTLQRAFAKSDAVPSKQASRLAALSACAALSAYQLVRLAVGLSQTPNRDYWQTIDWVTRHVPTGAGVMTASYIGLSLPQPSFDFYRVLVPYESEDPPHLLAAEMDRRHLTFIIRDDEWRYFESADMATYLALRGNRLATFGSYEIFEVLPPQGLRAAH